MICLGSGEAQEREVVGGTPNLAARLQGIAEPENASVIAEGTRNIAGRNCSNFCRSRPQKLKGVAGTARAFGGAEGKFSGETASRRCTQTV